MATLAIKGHATRGKEVIEILEMLGGQTVTNDNTYYIIDDGKIKCASYDYIHNHKCFTLEEFLEEFPYKIGDKVIIKSKHIYEINEMMWDGEEIKYSLTDKKVNSFWYSIDDLQPYTEQKEESMEIDDKLKPVIDLTKYCKDEYLVELGDYEYVLKDGKTYFIKKQPQYPKTYEGCCNILRYSSNYYFTLVSKIDDRLFGAFYKLKVCRDSYWRIAGDWKPNWKSCEDKFCITIFKNKSHLDDSQYINKVLAFPTEEMRNTFYENFKDLIEECKELL